MPIIYHDPQEKLIDTNLYQVVRNFQDYFALKKKLYPTDAIFFDGLGGKYRLVRNNVWWIELFETTESKKLDFCLTLSKIPYMYLRTVVSYFRENLSKEAVVELYWNSITKQYYISYPEVLSAKKDEIEYKPWRLGKDFYPVMTIHSHNTMGAKFSITDNENEKFGLYGVIGELSTNDSSFSSCFRAGLNGSFKEISIYDLFS